MYWSITYIDYFILTLKKNINLPPGIHWGPRISKGNKTSDDGYNKTVIRREPIGPHTNIH